MKVLFLNGVPDHSSNLFFVKGGRLFYTYEGSSNVGKPLKTDHFDKIFAVVGFDEYPILFENQGQIACIFNEISDADSHHQSLVNAQSILNSMDVPVINHPTYILNTTRDQIYQSLSQLDPQLIVPKTVRILAGGECLTKKVQQECMTYPLILRSCGSHGGIDTTLINDSIDLEERSKDLVPDKQYYLTQYYEYKNADNMYTKCRLLVIDGQVYIRHWMHSKEWLVHASKRRREYDLIEKKRIQSFNDSLKDKLQPLMTKIYSEVKLDYFGIDCHIDDHLNVVLFELNATMDVFSSSGGSEHLAVQTINDAINRLIINKLAANLCTA